MILLLAVMSNESEIKENIRLFNPSANCRIVKLSEDTAAKDVSSFLDEVNSLEKNQYGQALIITHGTIQLLEIDGIKRGNRFDENEGHFALNLISLSNSNNHSHPILGPSILDQIKYLSREKGIKEFHINSCLGGALIHDINRAKDDKDLDGVNINIYSSSKYSVPQDLMSFIGKSFKTQGEEELSYEDQLKTVAVNRLQHSAETIIFCSIANGEISAIKLRNPKENPQHRGFEKSKLRADQSHAFDSADNLLEYFENSALVPVYLNTLREDGKRISLPTNSAAQKILQQELSREAERLRANPDDLVHFYKEQLQLSLIKASSNKKTGSVLAIINAAKKLENPGEILNHRDAVGNSALIWGAGIAGDIEVTEALLKSGANINQSTAMGGTALMFAVMNGKKDIVEKLVNDGAGINGFINSYNNGTALDLALNLPEESEAKIPIIKSLLRGLAKEKERFEEDNKDQKFVLASINTEDLLQKYISDVGKKELDEEEKKELRNLTDFLTQKSINNESGNTHNSDAPSTTFAKPSSQEVGAKIHEL